MDGIQFTKLDGYEKWGTTMFWYDNNWNEVNTAVLETPRLSAYDTTSVSASVISRVYKKGLLGAGHVGHRNNSNNFANVWFVQINPDNGNTVWDTLMPNTASIKRIATNKGTIITQAALGFGGIGIRLYKVNLPDIPYQTKFYSSTKEPVRGLQKSKIYPNPSAGFFKVSNNQIIKNIKVYTINGILLKNYRVNAKKTQLTINTAGVYILQIESQNGTIETQKLVVVE